MLDKKACREFAAPGFAMSMSSGLLHAEQVKYIVQTAMRIIGHLIMAFRVLNEAA